MYQLPHSCPQPTLFCINSIHQWLTSNSLKINPTKTESIFLHLPLRSYTLPDHPILLSMTTLTYSEYVRNIGIHIVSTLSLDTHIAHMQNSTHYYLHYFRLSQRSIPLPVVVIIASSYILPYSTIVVYEYIIIYCKTYYSISPSTN